MLSARCVSRSDLLRDGECMGMGVEEQRGNAASSGLGLVSRGKE